MLRDRAEIALGRSRYSQVVPVAGQIAGMRLPAVYTDVVKIALAQIDPTVGDFTGNLKKIVAFSRRAAESGARLTVFSELAICGYPPADFLEKPSFLARCQSAVDELRAATRDLPTAVLAGVALPSGREDGKSAFNAAVLIDRGQLLLEQHKRLLPFYDVFDEQRYFSPSGPQKVIDLDGMRLAITICEDAWNDKNFWPRRLYAVDPMEELMRQNPALHINLSSSPFWHGKRAVRREMLAAIARRDGIPVLMCEPGGRQRQPHLRRLLAGAQCARRTDRAGRFVRGRSGHRRSVQCFAGAAYRRTTKPKPPIARWCWARATTCANADFSKVIVGLSGGIDSALVAAIAADALGAENVICIGMPSPYSSSGSVDDSRQLAANLGIRFETISINELFADFNRALAPLFSGLPPDLTEENIQPRIRGTHPDGAFKQTGRPGADHGQQIRDGRRLLHSLWRHGGRARGDRRPGEDAGVCRMPLAQS